MKLFSVLLISTAAVVQGQHSTSQYSPQSATYFDFSGHKDADYTHPYESRLPGADFNKQVYEFDSRNDKIFDQQEYESRVRTEAEMLVALEALKDTTQWLDYNIHDLIGVIEH